MVDKPLEVYGVWTNDRLESTVVRESLNCSSKSPRNFANTIIGEYIVESKRMLQSTLNSFSVSHYTAFCL